MEFCGRVGALPGDGAPNRFFDGTASRIAKFLRIRLESATQSCLTLPGWIRCAGMRSFGSTTNSPSQPVALAIDSRPFQFRECRRLSDVVDTATACSDMAANANADATLSTYPRGERPVGPAFFDRYHAAAIVDSLDDRVKSAQMIAGAVDHRKAEHCARVIRHLPESLAQRESCRSRRQASRRSFAAS